MKSTEMQPVINIDNGPRAFLKYSGRKAAFSDEVEPRSRRNKSKGSGRRGCRVYSVNYSS